MSFFIRIMLISVSMVALAGCKPIWYARWQDELKQARVAAQAGDHAEAIQRFRGAIEKASANKINEADLGLTYFQLAKSELAQGDENAAASDLEKAIKVGVSGWGKDSETLIPIYKESARLDYKNRRFAKAETAAREALRLEKECCGSDSYKLDDTLNLAISAACAGDRCADTEPLLKEQLEIRKRGLGDQHPHVAVSLCLLGELAEKKGEYKEAQSYFARALEIRKKKEPALVAVTEKNLKRVQARAGSAK